jgi:hypothetical protein
VSHRIEAALDAEPGGGLAADPEVQMTMRAAGMVFEADTPDRRSIR